MSSAKVRTHVLLSKTVLDEIDALVGERKRSEFIDGVLQQQLRRRRLLAAMDAVDATPPPPGDPPEWETPEGVAKWVHDLRREESGRTRRVEELLSDDVP